MTSLLAAHRDRLGSLVPDGPSGDSAVLDVFDHAVLPTMSAEQALSACVVLVENASAHQGMWWTGGRFLADLARRALPWTAADVDLLLTLARRAPDHTALTVLKAAVAAAESLDPAERTGLVEQFREARRRVEVDRHEVASQRARVGLRVRALIE